MFCRNCGNEIPDGARFCSRCGKSINGNSTSNKVSKKKGLIIAGCVIIGIWIISGLSKPSGKTDTSGSQSNSIQQNTKTPIATVWTTPTNTNIPTETPTPGPTNLNMNQTITCGAFSYTVPDYYVIDDKNKEQPTCSYNDSFFLFNNMMLSDEDKNKVEKSCDAYLEILNNNYADAISRQFNLAFEKKEWSYTRIRNCSFPHKQECYEMNSADLTADVFVTVLYNSELGEMGFVTMFCESGAGYIKDYNAIVSSVIMAMPVISTQTVTPTNAPINTETPTPEPTATNTPTPEPTATNTPTPEPTATNTPTPKPTATNTPTPKPTATNTPTPKPTATNTPTPKPTATNTPTPAATSTPRPTPTPTRKPSVYYSTNDKDTVKNGNTGIYAYRSRGGQYYIYYLIDFDNGYVYRFLSNDSYCDRLKIDSGDLNSVVIITYHDVDMTWSEGLCFKRKRIPDRLIHQDYYGFITEFEAYYLDDTLEELKTKTIIDY